MSFHFDTKGWVSPAFFTEIFCLRLVLEHREIERKETQAAGLDRVLDTRYMTC